MSVLAKIRWLRPDEGGRDKPPCGQQYSTVAKFEAQTEEDWLTDAWSLVLSLEGPPDENWVQTALVRFLADEEIGQFEESSDLALPAMGLGAGHIEAGHHPGHQEHDHHVDGEGHPVGGAADRQGVIGGGEENVVGEESADDADHPGRETTGHHADHHGNDENEGGGGDTKKKPAAGGKKKK